VTSVLLICSYKHISYEKLPSGIAGLSLGGSSVSFLARFDGGEPPAENTGSSRLLPEN
jgi:hypothetical protein